MMKDDEFLNSVYIIKSIVVIIAIWQKDFGTSCFSVDYFHQLCSPFLKVGMEIKCFESVI